MTDLDAIEASVCERLWRSGIRARFAATVTKNLTSRREYTLFDRQGKAVGLLTVCLEEGWFTAEGFCEARTVLGKELSFVLDCFEGMRIGYTSIN